MINLSDKARRSSRLIVMKKSKGRKTPRLRGKRPRRPLLRSLSQLRSPRRLKSQQRRRRTRHLKLQRDSILLTANQFLNFS